MLITIYGIKNCDSVRKARKWLGARSVAHRVHDFRHDGLERELLTGWAREMGIEMLLNKRGTTWRKLPEESKVNLTDNKIIDLMLANPAMIKRPVFDFGDHRRVGFSAQDQAEIEAYFMGG